MQFPVYERPRGIFRNGAADDVLRRRRAVHRDRKGIAPRRRAAGHSSAHSGILPPGSQWRRVSCSAFLPGPGAVTPAPNHARQLLIVGLWLGLAYGLAEATEFCL